MKTECIFCQIASGSMGTRFVAQNEHAVAFMDQKPEAPVHILVVPRTHVTSLAEADDGRMLGQLLLLAAEVARVEGIADSGYRTVANTGQNGGQSVGHLHLHVLGGRKLEWPPG